MYFLKNCFTTQLISQVLKLYQNRSRGLFYQIFFVQVQNHYTKKFATIYGHFFLSSFLVMLILESKSLMIYTLDSLHVKVIFIFKKCILNAFHMRSFFKLKVSFTVSLKNRTWHFAWKHFTWNGFCHLYVLIRCKSTKSFFDRSWNCMWCGQHIRWHFIFK